MHTSVLALLVCVILAGVQFSCVHSVSLHEGVGRRELRELRLLRSLEARGLRLEDLEGLHSSSSSPSRLSPSSPSSFSPSYLGSGSVDSLPALLDGKGGGLSLPGKGGGLSLPALVELAASVANTEAGSAFAQEKHAEHEALSMVEKQAEEQQQRLRESANLVDLLRRHVHAQAMKGTLDSVNDYVESGQVKHWITGRTFVEGQLYDTVCTCHDSPDEVDEALQQVPPARLCHDPSKLRVHQEERNNMLGLSREELRTLLGRPTDTVLVSAAASSFACIDGRSNNPVLGTPGGDFGEFLMGLSEIEHTLDLRLSEAQVHHLLKGYLDFQSKPMYFHTDTEATLHLQRKLTNREGQAGVVVGLDLNDPDEQYRKQLFTLLESAANHGCGFVKQALDDPESLYLSPSLPRHLIASYFMTLWDKQTIARDGTPYYTKLQFETLDGHNHESAWVNFRGNSHCEDAGIAPAFRPLSTSGASSETLETLTTPAPDGSAVAGTGTGPGTGTGTDGGGVVSPPANGALLAVGHGGEEQDGAGADTEAGLSLFVNHPAAVKKVREKIANYLTRSVLVHHMRQEAGPDAQLRGLRPENFLQRLMRRGNRVMEMVAETLGRDVPFYTVTVE